MMEAPSYPIATLAEIALIPEEAFDRFMAEFPMIIATVRTGTEAVAKMYEGAGLPPLTSEKWAAMTERFRWIDDDKGNVSAGITLKREDGSEHKLVEMQGNYKTGKFSTDIDIPSPAS